MAAVNTASTNKDAAEAAWSSPSGSQRGALAWFLQRLTAVLLLAFLGAHLWVLHFAVIGEVVDFTNVTARLHFPWFVVIDSLLLAVAIYHGLNGLRTVLFDFNIGSTAKRWLTFIFWLFGAAFTVYGINALLPFMGYSPFIGG